MSEKVIVETVNKPGYTERVDAAKYHATRAAMLHALPSGDTGPTFAEMLAAIKPLLPQDLFPGGKTAGWWCKCVQLDLEAKGIVRRLPTKPLRFVTTDRS